MTTDKNGIVRNVKNEIIGVIYKPTLKNKLRFRFVMFKVWLGKIGKAATYAINR